VKTAVFYRLAFYILGSLETGLLFAFKDQGILMAFVLFAGAIMYVALMENMERDLVERSKCGSKTNQSR